jgi:NTP pyrophosphatase (non-canonical NTP hydrolase)
MSDLEQLKKEIIQFRDERNWAQFHTGKDIAICLSIEASELLENYLWKSEDGIDLGNIKDELADVFYSAILLAATYDMDIKKIVLDKLEKNKMKYPVDKARNSNLKYNKY